MEERPAEPWSGAFRSYAGWVPNVRSHLSFSMIGAARGAKTFTLPLRLDPVRIVVVLQRRVVNDFPLPGWLARRLVPDIAVHWVMEAETAPTTLPVGGGGNLEVERDRQGMLRGRIYFMPRQETKRDRRHQDAALAGIGAEIERRKGRRSTAELRSFRSEVRAMAESGGRHVAVEFALMRTGECRLWYELPGFGISRARLDRIAEQAYYFIKDVVHDHKHHDPTSDQITPLVRYRPAAVEPGHAHEAAWRRETLWSLSREVERLNRDGGLSSQRRSLGIIAYAEAFQAALMGHVRDEAAPKGFSASSAVHDYDFKHLKDSIRADIDVNATRLSQRVQVAIAAVATFVSTTALATSLVSAHNGGLARRPDGRLKDPASLGGLDVLLPWLDWNPALTGLAATVLLLAVISYFLLDGRAGVFNSVQRVISQFGRALSATLATGVRAQYVVDLLFHLVSVTAAVAITFACVAAIIWAA